MKDPIELEEKATERLIETAKLVGVWLLAVLGMLFLAGFVGLAIGILVRAARWAVGE